MFKLNLFMVSEIAKELASPTCNKEMVVEWATSWVFGDDVPYSKGIRSDIVFYSQEEYCNWVKSEIADSELDIDCDLDCFSEFTGDDCSDDEEQELFERLFGDNPSEPIRMFSPDFSVLKMVEPNYESLDKYLYDDCDECFDEYPDDDCDDYDVEDCPNYRKEPRPFILEIDDSLERPF